MDISGKLQLKFFKGLQFGSIRLPSLCLVNDHTQYLP